MANRVPDRRRINGPSEGTFPPIFVTSTTTLLLGDKQIERKPGEIRKIFLRTGLISSTTGSSFLEINPLKLSVSVLGPRPLPRTSSTPFAPHAILTTDVKFAPFAATARRGYIRDSSERDLSSRLYQALVGSIRRELYPKSRIEVVVTVLDSEDEGDDGSIMLARKDGVDDDTSDIRIEPNEISRFQEVGKSERALGCVLAGCITASSAALADAGIELFDLVSGGVASAFVTADGQSKLYIRDPAAVQPEDRTHLATCVLGYMAARDEITEIWMSGRLGTKPGVGEMDELVDNAVAAARSARGVLNEAAKERVQFIIDKGRARDMEKEYSRDVEMTEQT